MNALLSSVSCGICGAAVRDVSHDVMPAEFCQCTACDYIRKDDRDRPAAEEALSVYRSHNNAICDPEYVAYFRRFISTAILPFASEGRTGFDFGSGPAPVLSELLSRDYGYDMEHYDLFFAPEWTFTGKTYDLVTSTEVVEHLPDPLSAFRLFRSLLKEDGTLAIMTLLHPGDDRKFSDWFYVRDKTHISFYTRRTMEVLATKTGLRLRYTDGRRMLVFGKC